MSKNTYIILGVIVVLAVIGVIMWQGKGSQYLTPSAPGQPAPAGPAATPSETAQPAGLPAPAQSQPEISAPPAPPQVQGPAAAPAESNVVSYTDAGYSPATLRVAAGTTVAFRNNSSREMWPASAMHPTHKIYPGSGIEKCGTQEEPNIFDACRGIAPGGSWSFKFDAVGSWKYHDHLNLSFTGTIVVE